jgi:hypothetical protein
MPAIKRNQIDFVINLRKQGKTFPEIALAFGKRFGIRKSVSAMERIFKNYKDEYDLKSLKSTVEVKAEVVKNRAIDSLLELISIRKYVPIMAEFLQHSSMSTETIKRHFESFEGLVAEAKLQDPKTFKNIIDESMFTDEAFKALRIKVSENNRFFITSAVTGCDVHEDGLKAIQTYCKKVKAELLILPCSDPAKESGKNNKWTLSHKLPKESVVFKDLALNDNIVLSTIKMSAKQLQPLTGIKRLSQKKASTIVASPKQFLEYVSNSNNNTELPRALMSTGAITKSEYKTNRYMSERVASLAEIDHTLGGIIVEIKNGKVFFARFVQINKKTGSFTDIDKKYNADGTVEKVTADLVQTGDWHVLSTDPVAKKMAKELVEICKPKYLTFEDFFDGITINPHEKHDLVALSKKAKRGMLSLQMELEACRKEIDEVCTWPAEEVVMKYGNHEDFLKRYLKSGDFMDSPENKILGMKLTIALEELEINPFEYAMKEMFRIKNQDKVRFLSINDSFKINGIENGAHGHMGKAGRRNPAMAELEECYGSCNVGHNHSAAVFRSVFRVGTGTKLQLSYNDGASAWTQTHLIQHKDGSRQLITNINGEWRL